MALNAKHILFVNDYMISHNATESYQKVYECTEDAARKAGSRLLTNVDIKSEIVRRQEEVNKQVEEKTGVSVEWVLEELKDTYLKAKERYDFSPANKSLELIGKQIGMFKDKLEVTGEGGSALQIIFSSKMKKDAV